MDHETNNPDKLAVAFAIVLPTLVTILYFVVLADSAAWIQQSAYAIGKTIQFFFPVGFVWLFQRDRLRLKTVNDNTAPPPIQTGNWTAGIGFGLLVVASMFVAWFVFLEGSETGTEMAAAVNEKVAGMQLNSTTKFLMLGLFYAIFHSFMEEYYWRWFVFKQLDLSTSTAKAILISSLGFAAHHVIVLATFFGWSSPLTLLFSFGVAIGGVIWAVLYHRSNLAVPWISHMIVDAGIFALGYLIVFQ